MNINIANTCEFVQGEKYDYDCLKEHHYVIGDPVCVRQIWKVRGIGNYRNALPDPIGVIVYSVPIGEWAARNVALGRFFDQYPTKSKRQSAINAYITYIARIIIDPRFHRQGIGSFLLRESLQLQTHALVETMTPIDKYSPMFVRQGFRLHFQQTPPIYTEMRFAFERAGIPEKIWHIPEIVQERIDHLSKYHAETFNRISKKFLQRFHHHEDEKSGITRTRYILSKIYYPNAYLLYLNPNYHGDEFVQDD